jgi:hypothetical protein
MQYPTNYDFGANWRPKIVPYLDDSRVKKALRTGINSYLSNFPGNKKYKKNTTPANYSSKDAHCMLMDRKCKIYMEELEKSNLLPKEYIKLRDNCNDDDDGYKLLEMEIKITKPLYKWENVKYDLESYYISGACHWLASTFELTLAKIIEPNEEWRVRVSDKHSTVINKAGTKVFDFLYWCSSDRLDNYVFGDELKDQDDTLGGKAAYLDSS